MASEDAPMDVEENEENGENEDPEEPEEPEEKKEELDPIAIMEAKLERINELTQTDEEDLSEKVYCGSGAGLCEYSCAQE